MQTSRPDIIRVYIHSKQDESVYYSLKAVKRVLPSVIITVRYHPLKKYDAGISDIVTFRVFLRLFVLLSVKSKVEMVPSSCWLKVMVFLRL